MSPRLLRLAPALLLALAALAPARAGAHIEIVTHETRFGPNYQKVGPCGLDQPGPGATVYSYAPGETVVIGWNEFIDHPGHYRVAFDQDGDDDFLDPATADDLYNNAAVILDGIPDEPNVHDYEVELQLPDVECANCTIQILQIMTDKPPYGDGNDIYYHCIDVELVAGGGTDTTGDGDTSGGTDTTGDGDTSGGTDTTGDGDTTTGDGGTETGSGGGDEAGSEDTAGDDTPGSLDDEAGSCSCSSAPAKSAPTGLALLALVALGRRRRLARERRR